MLFRRVALLIAMYVVLDFANPMMPGAVRLVGGSIEMVAGCQARGAPDAAPLVTALPHERSTIVLERERRRSGARIVSAPPPAPLRFRVPMGPRRTPPSSPDDD